MRSDYVDAEDAPIVSSWSQGLGHRVTENAQIRIEYAGFTRGGRETIWLQSVVAF